MNFKKIGDVLSRINKIAIEAVGGYLYLSADCIQILDITGDIVKTRYSYADMIPFHGDQISGERECMISLESSTMLRSGIESAMSEPLVNLGSFGRYADEDEKVYDLAFYYDEYDSDEQLIDCLCQVLIEELYRKLHETEMSLDEIEKKLENNAKELKNALAIVKNITEK